MCDERSRLLRRLQAEDFAVYEAVLYLDGHKGCRHALAYYHRHLEMAARLRAEYEKKYGSYASFKAKKQDHVGYADLQNDMENAISLDDSEE